MCAGPYNVGKRITKGRSKYNPFFDELFIINFINFTNKNKCKQRKNNVLPICKKVFEAKSFGMNKQLVPIASLALKSNIRCTIGVNIKLNILEIVSLKSNPKNHLFILVNEKQPIFILRNFPPNWNCEKDEIDNKIKLVIVLSLKDINFLIFLKYIITCSHPNGIKEFLKSELNDVINK